MSRTINAHCSVRTTSDLFLFILALMILQTCSADIFQAGGFTLEEPALRERVERIDGTEDSVYGLPVDLMCDLIAQAAETTPNNEES